MTISNHPIPLFTTKSRYVFKMEPKLGHLVKLWEILGCKYRVFVRKPKYRPISSYIHGSWSILSRPQQNCHLLPFMDICQQTKPIQSEVLPNMNKTM